MDLFDWNPYSELNREILCCVQGVTVGLQETFVDSLIGFATCHILLEQEEI